MTNERNFWELEKISEIESDLFWIRSVSTAKEVESCRNFLDAIEKILDGIWIDGNERSDAWKSKTSEDIEKVRGLLHNTENNKHEISRAIQRVCCTSANLLFLACRV